LFVQIVDLVVKKIDLIINATEGCAN